MYWAASSTLTRGDPHGHEFQHRHGAGGILQQGMVDPDGDLLAGDEPSLHQMGFKNLAGEIFAGHAKFLLMRCPINSNRNCAARPTAGSDRKLAFVVGIC